MVAVYNVPLKLMYQPLSNVEYRSPSSGKTSDQTKVFITDSYAILKISVFPHMHLQVG